jgi:hypothetical protein
MAVTLAKEFIAASHKLYKAKKALDKVKKAQKDADKAAKAIKKVKSKPVDKVGSKAEQSVQKMNSQRTRDSTVKKGVKKEALRKADEEFKKVGAFKGLSKYPARDVSNRINNPKLQNKIKAKRTQRELKSIEKRRKRENKTSSGTKYTVE